VDVTVITLLMPSSDNVRGAMERYSGGKSKAPVATIRPCPGIRRGAESVVPTTPGLVSDTVVPMKSSGLMAPLRARATRSSKACRNDAKSSRFASLMFGTSSVRVPSFFWTSTAMPSRTESRWMRWACPSSSA
jgi:hypothetical protein